MPGGSTAFSGCGPGALEILSSPLVSVQNLRHEVDLRPSSLRAESKASLPSSRKQGCQPYTVKDTIVTYLITSGVLIGYIRNLRLGTTKATGCSSVPQREDAMSKTQVSSIQNVARKKGRINIKTVSLAYGTQALAALWGILCGVRQATGTKSSKLHTNEVTNK